MDTFDLFTGFGQNLIPRLTLDRERKSIHPSVRESHPRNGAKTIRQQQKIRRRHEGENALLFPGDGAPVAICRDS